MCNKFVLSLALILLTYFAVAAENEITVAGTGSNEGILKELASAFMKENPGTVINVPPSIGTDGGVNGCADGKFELGRIGRPLKPVEKNLGLTEILFSKMPVVFIVNEKEQLKNLSTKQILDIYEGKIVNWKQVGGEDKKIYVISRDPGESSLIEVQKSLEGFKNITVTDKAIIAHKDGEMTAKVEEKDGAIGFGVGANMKNRKVNIIKIDNISPVSGNYKIYSTVGLIYKKELTALSKKFVDYINSEKGAAILKSNYCIPIK